MARISFHQRATSMLLNDIRLAPLCAVAQILWFRLVHLIHELGTEGMLDLSGETGAPFGSFAELRTLLVSRSVSGLVSFDGTQSVSQRETQTETEFDALIELCVRRGLLQRPAPDRLGLPADLGLSRRAIAARINGQKGGRPRKQSTMLLPISGGQSAVKTETQPYARTHADRSDLSLSEISDRSDQTREAGSICDTAALAEQLTEQLGVTVRPADAAGAVDLLGSVETVRAACQKIRARAQTAPRFWGFYSRALESGKREGQWENRTAPAPVSAPATPRPVLDQPELPPDVMTAWTRLKASVGSLPGTFLPLNFTKARMLKCADGQAVIALPRGMWLDRASYELPALQQAWEKLGRPEQLQLVADEKGALAA
ncbi:hypothetical protein [Granulibacter bethesdensis]|uniref:hypothetical protein n=1 Tax=Granulibacter bethesdensis TaxID=364410 RepID=UPI0003F1ECA8|nr:hypothetical protein [Granulibacter bethesdensis]AHJ69358.1 Hypothetical protein GbCGDNIH2_7306 [Granulibacter bethesdensis]